MQHLNRLPFLQLWLAVNRSPVSSYRFPARADGSASCALPPSLAAPVSGNFWISSRFSGLMMAGCWPSWIVSLCRMRPSSYRSGSSSQRPPSSTLWAPAVLDMFAVYVRRIPHSRWEWRGVCRPVRSSGAPPRHARSRTPRSGPAPNPARLPASSDPSPVDHPECRSGNWRRMWR